MRDRDARHRPQHRLKVIAQRINVPAVDVRLTGLDDMPSLPNELGETRLA